MLSIAKGSRIFLYGSAVDLRNGFDGLSFLAHTAFKDQMIANTYFVFINPRRTRMKILYWNGNNLVIWYLRLRKGTFFPPGQLNSNQINEQDLQMILEQKMPHQLFCL